MPSKSTQQASTNVTEFLQNRSKTYVKLHKICILSASSKPVKILALDAACNASCRTNKELKKAEGDVQKTDTLIAEACSKVEAEKKEVERRLQAAQKEAEEHLREAEQAEAELASYKVQLPGLNDPKA